MEWIMDVLQSAAAVVVSLGVLGGAVVWLWRRVLDPLVDAVQATRALMEHELQPNKGGSLRDAVDRIEQRLEEHDDRHIADSDELWAVLAGHGIDRRKSR